MSCAHAARDFNLGIFSVFSSVLQSRSNFISCAPSVSRAHSSKCLAIERANGKKAFTSRSLSVRATKKRRRSFLRLHRSRRYRGLSFPPLNCSVHIAVSICAREGENARACASPDSRPSREPLKGAVNSIGKMLFRSISNCNSNPSA